MTDRLLALATDAVLTREHGASDARYLMDHGIPGAIWGAQGFGTQHSEEECVSIPSIARIAEVLHDLIVGLEQDQERH